MDGSFDDSAVTNNQVAADENGYLRRRLEAIERTSLKLNLGGENHDLKVLRGRLDVESGEVLRLRKKVDSLQAEKLKMSEVRAFGHAVTHFCLDSVGFVYITG